MTFVSAIPYGTSARLAAIGELTSPRATANADAPVFIRLTPTTYYYRAPRQEAGSVLSHIPQIHRDALEKTIRELHDTDYSWVMDRFDRDREKLMPVGTRMIDELLERVKWMHDLLEHIETLTDRQQSLAIAALKYFLMDEDLVTDKKGQAGLVDDALVVEAAMIELKDIERRKSQGD